MKSEKSDEEKELFWGRLNECLSSFRENIRVIVCGDLNARVGNVSVMDVTGRYRVAGINDSGEELTGLSGEGVFWWGILSLRSIMLTSIHEKGQRRGL